MAGAREIRSKIKSVQSTRKVTSALEMVSASKIKKAQDKMLSARPYARTIRQISGHLAHANPEYQHPFMLKRDQVERVGYVIISTDRGLCGGLNTNEFKKAVAHMRDWQVKGADIDVVTIGAKAGVFFKGTDVNIQGKVSGLGDNPELGDVIGVIKIMLDRYREGGIDRLYLVYNDFTNTMVQKPVVDQLLPLVPVEDENIRDQWDYIYEPEPETVLDYVLVRYIESLVYQGVLENLASEHAARMVAMKSASDNAKELIKELQLVYNKARQAAITQEISEIVSGAAAV